MARKMKNSGIEWINEIPESWEVNRIKNIFTSGKGLSITKENLIDNGLAVVSYGQIHSKTNTGVTMEDDLFRFVDFKYQKYYPQCQVYQYDFIFADTSEDSDGCGNCVYKRDNSILFAGYHSIILHSIIPQDNRYLAYLFKTDCWRKQIREVASGVKVFSITQKALINSSVTVPPFEEQQKIANYLDKKCAEIDSLSSDIQSQINVLEDYKKSFITEAVTKGLNPDVEMKDSGIEWIGEIPNLWSVHPVYYYFSERKNKNIFGVESNLLSLSYGKIVRKNINSNEGLLPESFNTYNIVEKDDIIIRPTDLQNDKRSLRTGIVKERGIITSAYISLKATKEINAVYFHYLLHAYDITKVFYNMGNGVRQGLNFSEFSKLLVIEPSVEEQCKIVIYLDKKCAEIESIIVEKKKQLEVLEQYKKSLIYEYVTGKKEV